MAEQFFKWFRDFIFVIIPGSIYLADLIFFLQPRINLNFLEVLVRYQSYSLYITIIIVLISYVFGYSIDLATRVVLHWIWHLKKNRENFKKGIESQINAINDTDKKSQEISSTYFSRLIMIRHLFISILLLFIILLFRQINGGPIILVFIIFLLALIFAYLLLRDQVKQIEK